MKKFLALALSAMLLLISCNLQLVDSTMLDEFTQELPTITYYVDDGLSIHAEEKSAILKEPSVTPSQDGLVFSGWKTEDGTIVTDWETEIFDDVALYAVWEFDDSNIYVSATSGDDTYDGSIEQPYKTLGKAIEVSENQTIVLMDSITEDEDITIIKDITIIAEKTPVVADSSGRAIASDSLDDFVTFTGTFTIKSGSLSLKNLILKSDKNNISIENGGVAVKLDNTLVKTAINGRAIDALIPEDGKDLPICISMNSSSIEMYTDGSSSQEYGRACGINIDIHDNTSTYTRKFAKAEISITNSTLLDKTEGTYFSVIPLQVFRTAVVDINIDNTQIYVAKNHYGIWLNEVGDEEKSSTVNISNSFISGYSAYYNKYVTNTHTNISSSILEGKNYNDNYDSGFFTVSLQYSVGSEIKVKDSTIVFNQFGSSTQGLAELSYVWDESYKDNLISFENCKSDFNNKPSEEAKQRLLYCLENTEEPSKTNNRLIIDDATLNNIIAQEYELIEGQPESYPNGIFSIATYVQLKTEV